VPWASAMWLPTKTLDQPTGDGAIAVHGGAGGGASCVAIQVPSVGRGLAAMLRW